MVRGKRKQVARRLRRATEEQASGRTLLLAAGGVVGLNLLLVGVDLWRGWRGTDYFYVFTLAVWVALFLIQTRIYARRRRRVEDLERLLDSSPGRKD